LELVVDTNILFSFFNERSRAREISISGEVILHSPAFALKELKEHKSDIMEDFSLNEGYCQVCSRGRVFTMGV
jgi:predicted nucleic acid-binding protein